MRYRTDATGIQYEILIRLLREQRAGRAAFIRMFVLDSLTPQEVESLHTILGKLPLAIRADMAGGILPEDIDLGAIELDAAPDPVGAL